MHTAIAVDAGQTKTKEANLKAGNLLAFTSKDTYGKVLEYLTDDGRKVWAEHGYDDDAAIAKHIVRNVSMMIKVILLLECNNQALRLSNNVVSQHHCLRHQMTDK